MKILSHFAIIYFYAGIMPDAFIYVYTDYAKNYASIIGLGLAIGDIHYKDIDVKNLHMLTCTIRLLS